MNLRWILMLGLAALLTACGTDPPVDPGSCTDECDPGVRTCQSLNMLVSCVQSADGCYMFITTECLDNEICENQSCQLRTSDCVDECIPPQTRCTSQGQLQTCEESNEGCYVYGDATDCPQGQLCDPGIRRCEAFECPPPACEIGQTQCQDAYISTCWESPQGCIVFGPAKECPPGNACVNDDCVPADCVDECVVDQSICTADGQIRNCARDAEGCAVLSEPAACPGSDTCQQGQCAPPRSCQDECIAGEEICVGNGISSCQLDGDGCHRFQTPQACPNPAQTCQPQGNSVTCGSVTPGSVMINEIFFDPLGPDVRDGRSPTFIELYGPPGQLIEGWIIEMINQNDSVYNEAILPQGARLDGYGYAVLAMEIPDTFMQFAVPFITNVYFILEQDGTNDALRNANASVVLYDDNLDEADAVSYDGRTPFGPNHVIRGRGTPVSEYAEGRSIGRRPGAANTNNNDADFLSYYPTPGFENTDLLINEIYFDQPGPDDSSETFVELVAPITGWEDFRLDGYILHAISGFTGDDYIFTGALPGIVMDGWNLNDGGGTEGYAVICNIDHANASLINLCTVPYEGVDFANGPDNFVLRFQGREIDAVGYGSFQQHHNFLGRGMPVPFPAAAAGQALGRWPLGDPSRPPNTNDNASDFYLMTPTPGRSNPLPSN